MSKDKTARLISIFFLGLLLLMFPVISIFQKGQTLNGIPVLFCYLFLVWLAIIIFIMIVVERQR